MTQTARKSFAEIVTSVTNRTIRQKQPTGHVDCLGMLNN